MKLPLHYNESSIQTLTTEKNIASGVPIQLPGDTLAEFRSVVKDTKSNTKNFTKSTSIHSDYQSVHFW